jgi:hypothetical protein
MEMWHTSASIPILEESGLFENAGTDVWRLFIALVLSTDMAKHFELADGQASALIDAGSFDLASPDHRRLALQLVMKIADVSNVARPWAVADRWADLLCLETFRQDDLEKASNGLTSPLNDRDKANKPASQIGFYTAFCLPLYGTVARIFPTLRANALQVSANLEVWKGLSPP